LPEIISPDIDAKRISNPGCHATGFIMSVRPLIDAGIVDPSAVLAAHSLTGYSGGGKAMIAEYEMRKTDIAPRQYALSQQHKHLGEMKRYSGLEQEPVFSPVVCDFYSGMLVGVPLPRSALRRSASIEAVHEALALYYEGRPLVKVRPVGSEQSEAHGGGFLSADAFRDRDDMEIFVTGKDDRIEIVSRYDNLGKGASGAAIQNMNLILGLPEQKGLVLGD
jgi:N-acetyl-gamma-glutamyl-phosphate reductase